MDGSAPRRCWQSPLPPAGPAKLRTTDGRQVEVRAIGPQDAEAEQRFFSALSPRSRYRRLLLGARSLPEPTLHALISVDQAWHVALVALADEGVSGVQESQIIADARYARQDDGCAAEFAIVVADGWQRQGLGRRLMRQLAEHARQAGVRQLFGHVLYDNLPMQQLVLALGGEIGTHPEDATLCLARLDLVPRASGSAARLPLSARRIPGSRCPPG